MRFFDHLLTNPGTSDDFRNMMRDVPVFACEQISDLYFAGTEQEYWDFEHFPNIAPIYPRAWLDFRAPPWILSEKGTIPWKVQDPDAWGFYCSARQATPENIALMSKADFLATSHDYFLERLSLGAWIVDYWLYWKRTSLIQGPIWMWRMLVTQEGAIARNPDRSVIVMDGSPSAVHDDIIEQIMHMFHMTREDASRKVYEAIVPYYHTALLSVSFVHCKNIRQEIVQPAFKRPHTNAQKRRGEKPYQPVLYRIVDIRPEKKLLDAVSQEDGGSTTNIQRRLHFCRPHFATYTAEAPLFGKLTGTYYVPLHRRGSIERGTIVKDYRLRSQA